jgi:hypothetical protein
MPAARHVRLIEQIAHSGDDVWAGPACAGNLLAEDRPRGHADAIRLGWRRDLEWLSQWLSHIIAKSSYDARGCGGRYKI